MSLIVDASVAVKWFLVEDGSGRAREIADDDVSAPDLILLEVFNAVRKRAKRGDISSEQVDGVLPVMRSVLTRLVPIDGLIGEASRLAQDCDHPIYDCVYLALARRSAVPLVTADAGQFAAAQKAQIEARLL